MGFCSAPALAKAFLAPGKPVDRIMRMLPQVGRFFPGEPVGETGPEGVGHYPNVCAMPKTQKSTPRRPAPRPTVQSQAPPRKRLLSAAHQGPGMPAGASTFAFLQ